MGALTAATGSELAGRRLQGCALRTCYRTVLRVGGGDPAGPPPLLRVFQMVQSSSVSCFSPSTAYRPALPAPRGGGRRREAPGGGGRLRGGLAPPLVRGAWCGARRDEHFLADDDRRVPSRSWSSEVPDRKRRSGRRHERRAARGHGVQRRRRDPR